MICPNCGVQVADSRFCENCGAPLPNAAEAVQPETAGQQAFVQDAETTVLQPVQPQAEAAPETWAPATQLEQAPYQPVVQPETSPYQPAAQPEATQPYTAAMPAAAPYGTQPVADAAPAVSPYGAQPAAETPAAQPYGQQPAAQPYAQPAQQPNGQQPAPPQSFGQQANQQPAAPAGNVTPYNQVEGKKKSGAGRVIGIIAVIAVALVAVIVLGMNFLGGSGSGSGSSSSPAASSSAVSSSAASSASTPAVVPSASSSSASSAATPSSSSASSAAPTSSSSIPAEAVDAYGNPTVYGVVELKGSDLSALLTSQGYKFDYSEEAYVKSDQQYFGGLLSDDEYMWDFELQSYDKGGGSVPVAFAWQLNGYTSAKSAMQAQNVVTERVVDYDTDQFVAIVYGPSMQRYLLFASGEDGEVVFMMFNQAAMDSDLFGTVIADDPTVRMTMSQVLDTMAQ